MQIEQNCSVMPYPKFSDSSFFDVFESGAENTLYLCTKLNLTQWLALLLI